MGLFFAGHDCGAGEGLQHPGDFFTVDDFASCCRVEVVDGGVAGLVVDVGC